MRLRQVYLASASPPVRHANVYGVDMPTRREFVAFNLSEEEICTVRALARPRIPQIFAFTYGLRAPLLSCLMSHGSLAYMLFCRGVLSPCIGARQLRLMHGEEVEEVSSQGPLRES